MAGTTKDAEVRVGITGTEEIAGAADRAFGPWERGGKKVEAGLKSVGRSIAGALGGVAQDVARVGTALGTLDLAASTAKFLAYREVLARSSAAVGTSIDGLRDRFKQLGDRSALPDEAIQRVSDSLRQATYDASDSSQSIKALADESLATGRSLEQLAPLGATLHESLSVAFTDIPGALARIRTAAEELGTVGGPAALQDDIAHLGGTLSQASLKTKADVANLIGAVAELGKGLPAQQQAQVQQRTFGRLLANPEGLRRQLGTKFENFYDEHGKVRDEPELIDKLRQNAIKRWGLRAREVLSQPQNFGPEATAALFAYDVQAAKKAAEAKLSKGAQKTGDEFRSSDVGSDIATRNKLNQTKRDEGGGLLARIQSGLNSILPESTLLRFGLLQVGARAAPAAIGALFGGGGAAGGTGLVGAGGAALGGLGGVALAGLAAGLLNLFGGLKMMGVDKLSAAMPHIRGDLQQQLEQRRLGRVGMIVRAGERAASTDPTPEGFRRELGPRLVSTIEGYPAGGIPGDEGLKAIARGLATGTVPASVSRDSPDLVAALREALKDSPLEVVVHIEDASSHPNQVVARSKGAVQ